MPRTAIKNPTPSSVSRALNAAGHSKSSPIGRGAMSSGFYVEADFRDGSSAVLVRYFARMRVSDRKQAEMFAGYAASLVAAGYAVETDPRYLIVTAKEN